MNRTGVLEEERRPINLTPKIVLDYSDRRLERIRKAVEFMGCGAACSCFGFTCFFVAYGIIQIPTDEPIFPQLFSVFLCTMGGICLFMAFIGLMAGNIANIDKEKCKCRICDC